MKTIKQGLALQGGGVLGIWGAYALIAYLESEPVQSAKVQIEFITGTSAGAVNGALLAYALNKAEDLGMNGPAYAAKILRDFWKDVISQNYMLKFMDPFNTERADYSQRGPIVPAAISLSFEFGTAASFGLLDALQRTLGRHIPANEWHYVNSGNVAFYANAVESLGRGEYKPVLFHGDTMDINAVIASGALKELGGRYINGKHYYDGAYDTNPCFTPISEHPVDDLLIIKLHGKPKLLMTEKPKTLKEDRAGVVTVEVQHDILQLMDAPNRNYKIHGLCLEPGSGWTRASRFYTHPNWMRWLANDGYAQAQEWLKLRQSDFGTRDTYVEDNHPDTRGQTFRPGVQKRQVA